MRAAMAMGAVMLACGAGCTSAAVPYSPPRELVNAIPKEMAEEALRETCAIFAELEEYDGEQEIRFHPDGFTVIRTVNTGRLSTEVSYSRSTWTAFRDDFRVPGVIQIAFDHYHEEFVGSDGKSTGRSFYSGRPLATLFVKDEEIALKTLDALASLGIDKAPD